MLPVRSRQNPDSVREMLLRSLTGKSLEERPDAAEWIKDIAAAFRSDLGILALHGISGLAEQLPGQSPIRIPLCGADDLILLLTHNAVKARQHLGIAVPPGPIMMPMLIVCKTLLGDLLEQQGMLGNANPESSIKKLGGILLVSPDAEMRARYFSMRVGPESVVTSYSACRMRPDGTVAAVSTNDATLKQSSVCFFLAHQRQMPDPLRIAFKPAVTILDLTHDQWIDRMPELIDWCTHLQNKRGEQTTLIVLLPFGDRLSRDALAKHSITIFPLDSKGALELVDGFMPIAAPQDKFAREAYNAWSFSAYALENPQQRSHSIYQIPDNNSADVLEIAKHIYQALDAVNEKYSHRDLRLSGWLVGTLLQLPIPVQWYEQHAYLMGNRQTLKKLISSIGSNVGGTLHLDLAPVLQSLRGQLEILYSRLSNANPKSEAFLQYYHEHLQPYFVADKSIALLVRNDVVSRALWPWLLSEGISSEHQRNLRVLTYKQVDGREMFDHMIATGPWPSRYRWQIGGRLGRTIDFLLYHGEEVVLEQQMSIFYSTRSQISYEKMRFSLLKRFDDIHVIPQTYKQTAGQLGLDLVTINDKNQIEGHAQQTMLAYEDLDESDPTLKSLFDLVLLDGASPIPSAPLRPISSEEPTKAQFLSWRDDSFLDSGEQPELDEIDSHFPVSGPKESCILLKIRMASVSRTAKTVRYLHLSSEGATECYISGQGDGNLKRVPNDEIEPGYILIRTDQEDRQTLFDRIVQLSEAQPTMKYLGVWREYWLEAIHSLIQQHASGRAKRGVYLQLQRQLATIGVRVTEVTIRDWVLGDRIGPGSLDSIKAVGTLSQHPMLQQYPQQVDKAFRQIRIIHQMLGRRISSTLQKLGKVAQQGKSVTTAKAAKRDIQLDPALSVPIDDLLDMLQFWEVIAVDQGPWSVPLGKVGVIVPNALYGGS
jgi:hypothetical protein